LRYIKIYNLMYCRPFEFTKVNTGVWDEFMSDNTQNTSRENQIPMSAEETENLIEQTFQSLQEDLKKLHFEDVVQKYQDEYAAAEPKPINEMSEEELESLEKSKAEVERQIIREQRFNRIRHFLQHGIQLKRDDTDSEFYRTAKELLDMVDRFESAPASVKEYQRKKFTTDLMRYKELLKGESNTNSQISCTEQAEIVEIDLSNWNRNANYKLLLEIIDDKKRDGVFCTNKRKMRTVKERLKKATYDTGDENYAKLAESLKYENGFVKTTIPFPLVISKPEE